MAEKILGMTLVTYQTGPRGQRVGRVLVEQGLKIKRELYLGIVLDRSTEKPVLMVSQEGGVEIEKVAEETPDRIFREYINPAVGLAGYQTRKLAFALGLEGPQIAQASKFMIGGLGRVSRHRRLAHRDQPADRHRRRRAARARRQDDVRRQRPVPARRDQGDARSRRRGSARDRGVEVLAELHQARRHHRLHGQRRGPGHGDDGHHQAGRRRAGKLPRRRRRRQRRADQERVSHPDVRQERQGGAHQHLRRHPALRRARRRGDCRGARSRRAGARSSSAWKGPTWNRGSRCCATAASTSPPPTP